MKNKQRGDILIMTLFLLVVFVVIMTAWAQFASRQAHTVTNQEQEEQAFAVAEAGIERSLFLLNSGVHEPDTMISNGSIVDEVINPETGEVTGTYVLSFSGGGTTLNVTSVGYDFIQAERCQEIDAVIETVTGALSAAQYYVNEFDHELDTVCGVVPGLIPPTEPVIVTPPGIVMFDDPFDETANRILDQHTPNNLGVGWNRLLERGAGNNKLQIKKKDDYLKPKCNKNGKSRGALYMNKTDMVWDDYDVSVRQKNGDKADDFNFLAARIQGPNDFYALKWNENNGQSNPGIYKREVGTWTLLASIQWVAIKDGSIVTLRVKGSIISALDDGVVIASSNDTAFSSGGRVGVGMGAIQNPTDDCSSQRLENFKVVTV